MEDAAVAEVLVRYDTGMSWLGCEPEVDKLELRGDATGENGTTAMGLVELENPCMLGLAGVGLEDEVKFAVGKLEAGEDMVAALDTKLDPKGKTRGELLMPDRIGLKLESPGGVVERPTGGDDKVEDGKSGELDIGVWTNVLLLMAVDDRLGAVVFILGLAGGADEVVTDCGNGSIVFVLDKIIGDDEGLSACIVLVLRLVLDEMVGDNEGLSNGSVLTPGLVNICEGLSKLIMVLEGLRTGVAIPVLVVIVTEGRAVKGELIN